MSRAIITDKFPELILELEKTGVDTIKNTADLRLPINISHHTDLQVCILSRKERQAVVLKGNPLKQVLENLGYTVYETKLLPQNKYPLDCLCNAVTVGKYLFCNEKVIDETVLNLAHDLGYMIAHVNQGYTACSICKISENAIITADEQIYKRANELHIDVLKIKQGGIDLKAYDYGFIGGCYGVDGENIYFSGSLESLHNFYEIKDYISLYNKKIIELSNHKLNDIGGIMFT